MKRCSKDFLSSSDLDEATTVKYCDPIGDLCGDAQIVGNQDEGAADTVTQVADQLENLSLDRDVKRRRGFVSKYQSGVTSYRHRSHYTLTLTT